MPSKSNLVLLMLVLVLMFYNIFNSLTETHSNGLICNRSGEMQGQNLVLSYFSGKFDFELFNIFVRSLRATGSSAAIVVMIYGFEPSDQAKALAEVYNAQLLPVPESLLKDVPWANDGAIFRFRAWNWYLQNNHQKFCHVLNADMDVYFQTDPFACFFGVQCNRNENVLHSFAENPALTIGACPVHRNWYVNDCKSMGGQRYFQEHRHRLRICSGFSIGTTRAYLVYLKMMEEHIFLTRGQCNDQPIHNILIWGQLLKQIDSVYVWDYFSGPVKTIDSGYIQDEFGRVINEKGLPYCVVHQFKKSRNPRFFQKLEQIFPLHNSISRVHFEDTRFSVCNHDECKGMRVHSSVNRMIEQNMSGGWRGPLPLIQRILTPQGPLPSVQNSNAYSYLEDFLQSRN